MVTETFILEFALTQTEAPTKLKVLRYTVKRQKNWQLCYQQGILYAIDFLFINTPILS